MTQTDSIFTYIITRHNPKAIGYIKFSKTYISSQINQVISDSSFLKKKHCHYIKESDVNRVKYLRIVQRLMQRFSDCLAQEKLVLIPSKTVLLDKSLQLSSFNPNQTFAMSLF